MDCINRSQLDCAEDSILTIDAPLLKSSYSAVLVRAITIRHLPPITRQMPCAVTITVNGSTFTTPSREVQVEDDEDEMNEIDEITGNAVSSKIRKMGNTNSAMSSRVSTANNNNNNNEIRFGSRCGTGNSSTRSSYRQAAVKFLYKLHCDSLNVLFPGVRIPAREQDKPREDIAIEDPRSFAPGITIQVHSVDYSQIYGTTLVTFSGERAYLSYPRGEVKVAFRVYPCVRGVAQMAPLYNKHSLALTYLQGYTQDMAALTEQYCDAAGVHAQPAAIKMNAEECKPEKEINEPDAASAATSTSAEWQQREEEEGVDETEQHHEKADKPNEDVDAMLHEIEEEAIAAHCQQIPSSSLVEETNDMSSKEHVIMTDVDGQKAHGNHNEPQNTNTNTNTMSEINGYNDKSEKGHSSDNTKTKVIASTTSPSPSPLSFISIDGDPLTAKVLSLIPCIYEQNRKAAFRLYDTKGTGFITREQLLHFCRAHVPLADLYKDTNEPQTNNEQVLMEFCEPYLPPWPPRESHELCLTNNIHIEGDANHESHANQGDEANAKSKEQEYEEVITSRRAPTPRVNPDYLYCRPATPSSVAHQADMSGVNGTRSMRLGQSNEMLVPYSIFALIALKLARL